MKVKIEADSQEEFDQKRGSLLEQIAGPQYEVKLKKKGQTLAGEPRPAFYQAQSEMQAYWSKRFQEVLNEIKEEVSDVFNKG